MDLDRFIAAHESSWQRLDELTRRAGGRKPPLSATELEELVDLHQRTSTHLSIARTRLRDPGVAASLTTLVARSSAVVYGTRARTWRAVGRFFTDTFPAAVWHARAFVVISTLLVVVPAVAIGGWLATSPQALDLAAPPALREAYVSEDFAEYYTADPSAQFASTVTTNNIQVGITAFALGIAFCLPTVLILAFNGANVGLAAGLFAAAGEQPLFWGLILPHGLLELTAVFIAGATGLRLGWTLIDPGDRRRGDALAEEGRRAIVVVIGVALMFVVSGVIEGFVTGSPLPTWVRVGIGTVVETAFCVYVVVCGRQAAARGLTGALGENAGAGWNRATARAAVPAHSRPVDFTRR